MSMDLIFVIIVVLSIIAYFKFIGPDGDWGIIPKPLRLVVLPLYAFTSFYIIGVLFQIGLFVPGFATVFVNLLLILFIWLTNSWFISLIAFLFAIIGDIIVGIALGAYIVFACELPIFKNEPNTTFYFRLITLIFISFIFLSSFVFDHDLGVYAKDGGDAIKLIDWLCMRETFYKIVLHTANPVGRANMQRTIDRYWPSDEEA